MRLILETFLPHFGIENKQYYPNNNKGKAKPSVYNFMSTPSGAYPIQADCFIYAIGNENIQKSSVATRPLFMYPKGNEYTTTITTRDSKYTRSKLKRKKLHDDGSIYIEKNFLKIDVDYIRRQPSVMYVMNTEYKEHHEIWAYHAGLMFEICFVRSISTIITNLIIVE